MGLSDIIQQAKSAASTAMGAVGTVSQLATTASQLTGINVSNLISSLPTSLGSFLTDSKNILSMSSITGSLEKGTSQAIAKVKSYLGSDPEAIAKPVSFVTKTVSDTVQGVTTSRDSNSSDGLLSSFSPSALSSIASRAGLDSIASSGTLNTALSAISGDVFSDMSGVSGIVSTISTSNLSSISGLASTITGGLSGTNGLSFGGDSIAGQIASTLGGATSTFTGTSSTMSSLTTVASSLLPDVCKGSISYMSGDTLTALTSKESSKLSSTLSYITSSAPAIATGLTTAYSAVNSLTNNANQSYTYPTYLNDSGGPMELTNSFSSLNTQSVTDLYAASSALCGTVSAPNVSNYGEKKDLYDSYLTMGLTNGMSDLVSGLVQDTTYYDSRSKQSLVNSLPALVRQGDVQTVTTVVDTLGVGAIANPEGTLLDLATNMAYSDINAQALTGLMSKFGVSADTLVAGATYGSTVATNVPKLIQLATSSSNTAKLAAASEVCNLATQLYVGFSGR